jgi:hypothetical protein
MKNGTKLMSHGHTTDRVVKASLPFSKKTDAKISVLCFPEAKEFFGVFELVY